MKRFSQQFNTAAKRVSMTKAESRDLKERLTTYMEYHPLPESMKQTTGHQASVQYAEPFWIWRFNTVHTRAFASVATIAALIIVPIAAENAVPGDVLYPVKVQFNEEIRSTLALTPYQQIEWETKRVERRLAEARLLATEGKLTEAIEAEVAAAVRTHSDAAQAGLAELRETDSEEAAIAELAFASALEVESEVLESETERQQAAGASTTVTLAAAIADVRAEVAKPETTEVSFERLVALVESETTRAAELLFSLRNDVTAEERDDIDRRLADIDRKVSMALSFGNEVAVEAETTETGEVEPEIPEVSEETESETTPVVEETAATSTGTTTPEVEETEVVEVPEVEVTELEPTPVVITEATAKQLLREALGDTQKLIRFMTDIDVKNNVSVEELVPVTLTDEERTAALAQQTNSIEAIVTKIVASGESTEKTTFGLEQIANLLAQASSSQALGELAVAEGAVTEAAAIASDIERALGDLPATPVSTEPVATSTEAVAVELETDETAAGEEEALETDEGAPEEPSESEPSDTSTEEIVSETEV